MGIDWRSGWNAHRGPHPDGSTFGFGIASSVLLFDRREHRHTILFNPEHGYGRRHSPWRGNPLFGWSVHRGNLWSACGTSEGTSSDYSEKEHCPGNLLCSNPEPTASGNGLHPAEDDVTGDIAVVWLGICDAHIVGGCSRLNRGLRPEAGQKSCRIITTIHVALRSSQNFCCYPAHEGHDVLFG